jgi:hypothetical protein
VLFHFVQKKKIGQDISKQSEIISEVTIFKNQHFLNNKKHHLVVLREEVRWKVKVENRENP